MAIFNIEDDLRNYNCNLFNENVDQMDIYELIFTAIGWLTMSMPHPISQSSDGSNCEGREAFINLQYLEDTCDQLLSRTLGKFGLSESLLGTPPLYKAYSHMHMSQYFMISTICFHKLREVAKIGINWTEQLPMHLEFDKRRRVLTLFPFCQYINATVLSIC
jgi:hypothetical protein